MKTISIFILFVVCFVDVSFSQTDLIGKYSGRRGRDGFKIHFRQDSTFEQINKSCTWRYIAEGKWTVQADTVYLKPDRFYSIDNKGKKKLIKDVVSNESMEFQAFNKLVVLSTYSIYQLHYFKTSGNVLKIELNRQ